MAFVSSRNLHFLALVLLFCVSRAVAFEELVPTQPGPIGMLHDPANGCIYVIFTRQIKLVCKNATSTGTREIFYVVFFLFFFWFHLSFPPASSLSKGYFIRRARIIMF